MHLNGSGSSLRIPKKRPEELCLQSRLGTIGGRGGDRKKDAPLPLAWWVGKDDILRHSYGTYRAAILRNSHNLAEEMGNSVTMVRTYYDAVVSPSVAKLWWKIRPAKPKNLIPMKAAA